MTRWVRRFPNGLTAVVERRPELRRCGVGVVVGVGFQDELPGQEGLAHLVEHLYFQGSASLPDGRFHDHLAGSAGTSAGHTYHATTEYEQCVPPHALERALFAEIDRLRAPLVTEAGLRSQRAGVGAEILARTSAPLGDLPWPALGTLGPGRWARTHDGWGTAPALAAVTVEECQAFIAQHYRPDNATIAVCGPVDDSVLGVLERLVGPSASWPVPTAEPRSRPAPAVDELDRDRLWSGTEPGLRVPLAYAALRAPAVGTDQHAFLAWWLALTTARHPSSPAALRRARAGLGWFGPGIAPSDEVLVVTGSAPDGAESFMSGWREALLAWSRDARLEDAVARAVTITADTARSALSNPGAYARALARSTAHGADGLGAAPARHVLGSVPVGALRDALGSTARTPATVLAVDPGAERTRPAPAAPKPAAPTPAASTGRGGVDPHPLLLDPQPGGSDATTVSRSPVAGPPPPPSTPHVALEVSVPDGRLPAGAWLHDPRAAGLHLELRVAGAGDPLPVRHGVEELVRWSVADVEVRLVGGGLQVDAPTIDAASTALALLVSSMRRLGHSLWETSSLDHGFPWSWQSDAPRWGLGAVVPDPGWVRRPECSALVDAVAELCSLTHRSRSAAGAPGHVQIVLPTGGRREAGMASDEAVDQVLAAILGGVPGSRLMRDAHSLPGKGVLAWCQLEIGEDRRRHLVVRGITAPGDEAAAVERCRTVLRDLGTGGPSIDELHATQEWFRSQWWALTESPSALAGHLAAWDLQGIPSSWVVDGPPLVEAVSRRDVHALARRVHAALVRRTDPHLVTG